MFIKLFVILYGDRDKEFGKEFVLEGIRVDIGKEHYLSVHWFRGTGESSSHLVGFVR